MSNGGVSFDILVVSVEEAEQFFNTAKKAVIDAMQAVNAVGADTVNFMQAAVHVDTGELKASIHATSLGNDAHYVGQEITAPAVNKSGQEYAIYEEERGNSHAFFTFGYNYANDALYNRVSVLIGNLV